MHRRKAFGEKNIRGKIYNWLILEEGMERLKIEQVERQDGLIRLVFDENMRKTGVVSLTLPREQVDRDFYLRFNSGNVWMECKDGAGIQSVWRRSRSRAHR